MANANFLPSVGDVVGLISGGPPMTVEGLENAPTPAAGLPPGATPSVLVRCVWFNPEGAFAHGLFNAAVLTGGSAPAPSHTTAPVKPPIAS